MLIALVAAAFSLNATVSVQEAVKVCAAVSPAARAPRSFSRSLLLLTLSLHYCGAVPRGVLIHLAHVVR